MISIDRLTLTQGPTEIVVDLSLDVNRGETVLLIGESGVGKTTLLRALYGDLRPEHGRIVVDGISVAPLDRWRLPALRRRMGLIFQDDKLLDDRSVYDNLRFALEIQSNDPGGMTRRSLELLSELGLSHLRSKYPRTLSAGEAQRIGIARALAVNPIVILADEPTGDLDAETSREIFRYLASRRHPNGVMIIATHDLDIALQTLPHARRLRLGDGILQEESDQ